MSAWLESLFPGLGGTTYRVTSSPTATYNCIAWAVGLTDAWWWPVDSPARRTHWPAGVLALETIDAFRQALVTVGFGPSVDEQLEPGFEKIALFADAAGVPTHAARQLVTRSWTSKLGQGDDIEHVLRALEGSIYGTVVLVLKRPVIPGA